MDVRPEPPGAWRWYAASGATVLVASVAVLIASVARTGDGVPASLRAIVPMALIMLGTATFLARLPLDRLWTRALFVTGLGLAILPALAATQATSGAFGGVLTLLTPAVLALVLTFPGRLRGQARAGSLEAFARWLTIAAAAVSVLLVAMVPDLPGGLAGRLCDARLCTDDPLAVMPAPGAARALETALAVVLMLASIAVAVAVIARARRARGGVRRALTPMAAYAGVLAVVTSVAAVIQIAAASAPGGRGEVDHPAPVVVLLCIAILVGVGRSGMASPRGGATLASELARVDALGDIPGAMERGLGITGVEVLPHGSVLASGRAGIELSRDGTSGPMVVLAESDLASHRECVDDARQALVAAAERAALRAEIDAFEATMRDMADRARDDERRRIERDLHDGMQQHLIALRYRIGALQAMAVSDPGAARLAVDQLALDAELALERARGSVVASGAGARSLEHLQLELSAAGERATVPVDVSVDQGPEVGHVACRHLNFIGLECIQNAMKHGAPGAPLRIVVRMTAAGSLEFDALQDEGGIPPSAWRPATTPASIADRAASLHATAEATWAPGGFRVRVLVPAHALAEVDAAP